MPDQVARVRKVGHVLHQYLPSGPPALTRFHDASIHCTTPIFLCATCSGGRSCSSGTLETNLVKCASGVTSNCWNYSSPLQANMDFFRQAASFVASNKADESDATSSDGGFDVNKVSDFMSKAQGFLDENKPEAVGPKPVEDEEVMEKPSSEVTHEVQESRTAEEDPEKEEFEKPSSADTVKPTEPEEQDSPATETTTTTTATSTEVPPESSKPDANASYSKLYGSAQTLYSGLRGKLEGKTDVDNQQLASAAENLVAGAESLGLLKPENPYSGYFKKAESFLQDYSSSDSAPKKPSSDENA